MENDIDSYKIIEGKKFMWDGLVYEEENKAQETENGYKEKNFETMVLEEEGKFLIYTRREVTEIVLDD